MAGSIWRKTDDGWERIRSIWRNTGGGWERIRSVWRKTSSSWERVFGTGVPGPKSDVNLWFIQPPYDSGSTKSASEAFQNSKMYIQRGKWENDPVYFETRIQKKPLIGDWELVSPPGINNTAFTYLANEQYSDDDFEEIWPSTSANWPTISLNDIKNKIKFRAKIKVFQSLDFTQTELDQLEYHFPTDVGIAPRLGFDLNPFAGEPIAEYEDLTNPTLKQYGIKWRYNTSYFSEFEAVDVIGRQIIEVTDFQGNIVIQPFEVPVGPGNPQLSIINYTQAMIDSQEEYIINLYIVAEDYYYNGGLTLEQYKNDTEQTIKLFSTTFQPPISVEDPTITIVNRTKSSLNIEWNSPDAEKYYVDIKTGGSSVPGYPKKTTDTSAFLFGLSENTRYDIYVTALAGANDQFESNEVTKCARTLTTGITPILGDPYDQTSNSFKVPISNYAFIDAAAGWDLQVYSTNGNASRSEGVILVSSVSAGLESCVTVVASNINNVDLCVQSWEEATSSPRCETIGTFYCVKTGPANFCTTFTANYDASGSSDGFITQCYLTQSCCTSTTYGEWGSWQYTEYGEWGACIQCQKSKFRTATRSRTKTVTNLDCSQTITAEYETKTFTTPGSISGETCTDCIVYENCCCTAGCTYTNKTYTGVVVIENCVDGDRARKTYWTATETCINTACTVISQQTVTKFDLDYVACCTAGCTTGTKTYTANWSPWSNCQQGQISRYRPWEATQTCTDTSCNVTTSTVTGNDFEYANCCTAECTVSGKTYTANWSEYSNCVQGERSRSRPWTATQTCTNSSCVVTTTQITGTDFEYAACCTASCTVSGKTYTANWSEYSNCVQGERSRSRPWTATQTCTDSSCVVTTTQITGTDFEYAACCTASCTTGTKTYSAWSAWSNCTQGERSRYRTWSATETCTNSSCVVTTSTVTGTEFEYAACCTASCTTGTKTYSAWSAWSNCTQGERSRYRTWSATETCTDSSCVVTTSTVTGTEFEYTSCCTASTVCTTGTRTYGAWGAWSNCVQGEQSRVRSWSEVTTCTVTDTSCNVTTTNTTNTGNEFEYRNCTVSPFFPFFPPFFPFFPPFFPFFPPFFPFFDPSKFR